MIKAKKWFWRLLPVGIGIGAIAYYYLSFMPERIRSNERHAIGALKMLTAAQADFRANDRDGNGVSDFWTADVAGLYYVRSAFFPGAPEIRLIDSAVADADARPLQARTPVPYHGYYFIVLDADDSISGTPESFYKQDTGGRPPMGKVHNTSRFGFCAYPAEYGLTGKCTFIVNENNTIFRMDSGGKPVTHFPDDGPKDYSGDLRKMD